MPGKPVPKARPRMTRQGRVYTPAETLAYERLVAKHAVAQGVGMASGPVEVDISVRFPIPPSWAKVRKADAHGAPHTQRPDLDNLAKSVLDGLNGVAWHDDAQVCRVSASKSWDADCGAGIVQVAIRPVH
ncbi:RusA family crossover junction endodeoxyribonuclease [Paracoccus sanguinis]|uniref:RusA family crossover junction endodeoxyribonuclease n=1 Tax=Paracoccus sanguinis TaxID=1545044 RepID=UPI002F42731F